MSEEEKKLLFKALSWTLSNQQKIMKHLGIATYNHICGWYDSELDTVIRDCDVIGYTDDYQ